MDTNTLKGNSTFILRVEEPSRKIDIILYYYKFTYFLEHSTYNTEEKTEKVYTRL
jgi:hypothetical protein